MKKIIITLSILFIIYQSAIAQKAEKGSLGLGLDYRLGKNNYFPALKLDYYLSNTISINFNFRPNYSFQDNTSKTVEHNTSSDKFIYSKFSMELGLGIDKHFMPKSKFDPFISLNMNYTFADKTYYDIYSVYSYENPINDILYRNEEHSKFNLLAVNGFNGSLGLGANYFLMKNLSFGAQFNFGYYYSIQKGEAESYIKYTTYENDIETSSREQTRTKEIDNTNQGFLYNASIKAAYYFNKKK